MVQFSGVDQGYKSYLTQNPGQKALVPPVAVAFRPILQQCFSTIWDNTVVVSPDPTLPIPDAEVVARVLVAIQHGYDKEWFRISRLTHTNHQRLSVDMLELHVQITLVQSLLALIEQFEQGSLLLPPETQDMSFGMEN